MNNELHKIKTGFRVAVIGGGPAGSFFALYLLGYAKELGIKPEITIYQKHDLNELGPKGCKGCAGILSMSLLKNLNEIGLTIPDQIILSKIEHYAVHSPDTVISISNPEKDSQIVSIYRGGGPRISHHENPVSFDGWLLKQAQDRGAQVEYETVSRIFLEDTAEIEFAETRQEYDLIVLASGANTKPVNISGLNYVPPKIQTMAQDELHASPDQIESKLGNMAHVFLMPYSGLIFGTLVPKGQFINVSVLSLGKHPVSVREFLNHEIVRDVLPDQYQRVCGCRPSALISCARNFYGNRFVAIGDTTVGRLYKDGIGSALLTAREAARTVAYHGSSRSDFNRYYRPFCKRIDRDNRWGRMLFSINNRAKNSSTFLLAQHRLIGDEQNNIKGPQPFTKSAWGMFTGSYSYRSIALRSLNPRSLVKLSWALLVERTGKLFRRGVTAPRRIHIGSRKVLILGSGFGGTYVLRSLVPALNRNENVVTTMISDENYFLFAPLLHKVAMGAIESRHIAYPIRRLQWRDRFKFVQATVEKIDLENRRVVTSNGTLEYDYLVMALGSITDRSGLNPRESNVFTLSTLRDSRLIRDHIIGSFERASLEADPQRQKQLLTFVISGAGYIGIQLAAELRDFIHHNLLKFYKEISPDDIRIMLIEIEPKIVSELHTKLAAYTMKHLRRMGVEVRLRSRVTYIWDDHVEINNQESIPTNTLIWVAGVVANPRISELDIERDSMGRVLVNRYLEVPGIPGVYALGDCAHFEDPKTGPIPPRAHTAVRQAKVTAHNILADIRGRDKKQYHYSNIAEMISLGDSKAAVRIGDLRLYGITARLIWLVAYSLLVTGTYNRIRVILDWLLSLVFGRDTTFLKLNRRQ